MMDVEAYHQEIGRRVKYFRLKAGMNQTELAAALKFERTSVTNIEAGRQRPPLVTLCMLAKVLSLGVKDLIPDDDMDVSQYINPPSLKETRLRKRIAGLRAELLSLTKGVDND